MKIRIFDAETENKKHIITDKDTLLHKYQDMVPDILRRVENVLNQGVDTESSDLDYLRHDLENEIINGGYYKWMKHSMTCFLL